MGFGSLCVSGCVLPVVVCCFSGLPVVCCFGVIVLVVTFAGLWILLVVVFGWVVGWWRLGYGGCWLYCGGCDGLVVAGFWLVLVVMLWFLSLASSCL